MVTKKIAEAVGVVLNKVTSKTVNSACALYFAQPREPESLKRLKKIK